MACPYGTNNLEKHNEMKKLITLLTCIVAAGMFIASASAEPAKVTWQDLALPSAKITNPFENLTSDQKDSLRRILRLEREDEPEKRVYVQRRIRELAQMDEPEKKAEADKLRKLARFELMDPQQKKAEADKIRAELAAQGLDADGLLAARLKIMEQRRSAGNSINEALIGEEIRIPGYVLPLEMLGRKAVEFLLVPTVGACIHTPPLPPNQMIHVIYPQGVEIRGIYDPAWVTGVVEADQSVQDVRYPDGQSRVEVSYGMKPARVEAYRTARATPVKTGAFEGQ